LRSSTTEAGKRGGEEAASGAGDAQPAKQRSSGEDGAARAEAKPRRSEPGAQQEPSEPDEEDGKATAAEARENEPRDGDSETREDERPRAPSRESAREKTSSRRASPERSAGQGDAEPASSASTAKKGKVRVSPLARSLAAELGVDPDSVQGTGPGGRVVRRDVEAAAQVGGNGAEAASSPSREPEKGRPSEPARARSAPERPGAAAAERKDPGEPAPEATPAVEAPPTAHDARAPKQQGVGTPVARPAARAPASPRPAAPEGTRRVPLSPMRASIARRMTESKREAPHFYLTTVADMDAAAALRESMRTSGTIASGVTYNHMIVKAAADALRVFPELNSRFAGDAVELLAGIHVGVATAVSEGLLVPVIHDADRLSLIEIAATARALGEKAKGRTFSGDDLSGGTFTVSNLGMYEVESFAAVINPPQAAILAVGSVRQRPVVRDGALVAAFTVALTLSCDHRAVDGARGAEFLRDVKGRLENPTRLLFPAADA
jgi:pyruvate dehydrogenase E2 component (dihydrolipoamide acetyltransferase)